MRRKSKLPRVHIKKFKHFTVKFVLSSSRPQTRTNFIFTYKKTKGFSAFEIKSYFREQLNFQNSKTQVVTSLN